MCAVPGASPVGSGLQCHLKSCCGGPCVPGSPWPCLSGILGARQIQHRCLGGGPVWVQGTVCNLCISLQGHPRRVFAECRHHHRLVAPGTLHPTPLKAPDGPCVFRSHVRLVEGQASPSSNCVVYWGPPLPSWPSVALSVERAHEDEVKELGPRATHQ